MIKPAISNIAWHPENRLEIYRLMADRGVGGLEIAPGLFLGEVSSPYDVPVEDVLRAGREVSDYGLTLVSMQSLHFGSGPMQLFGEVESRRALMSYSKKAVDFASVLGIPNLVFGSPKNRIIPDGMERESAEVIAVDFFRELGRYAHEHGTCIALEANAKEYGTNFMTTTREAINMVRLVDAGGVRLNLDLGTMALAGEGIDVLEAALPVANHIHLSAPYLNAVYSPDSGVDRELLDRVLSIDDDRYVSIEMKMIERELDDVHIAKALKLFKFNEIAE